MNLLLDTHALVWWFRGDQRMPERVRLLIDAEGSVVFVSAASAWELTTKYRLGKMPEAAALVQNFFAFMQRCEFKPLAVSVAHGHAAGLLEGAHKDPFDRMLVAQAIAEDLGLVTLDPAMGGLSLSGQSARVVW